jgi:MFS family permease
VIWVLAVGALDLGLEQFIVIPILPAVQEKYAASLTSATWLLTGFLLAAVVAVPTVGRLGDIYGKRRLLLVSIGPGDLEKHFAACQPETRVNQGGTT